jgi:hypothetical protein
MLHVAFVYTYDSACLNGQWGRLVAPDFMFRVLYIPSPGLPEGTLSMVSNNDM